jgi:probable HAF family extracellular repeat protein
VVGSYNGTALRWGPDGLDQSLGTLPGSPPGTSYYASAVNADGSVIAGAFGQGDYNEGTYVSKGFLWNAERGMLPMSGFSSQWREVHPTAMTPEATVLVGGGHWVTDDVAQQFNFRAFRWTLETGAVDLGSLPYHLYADARAVSDDGRVIVGWSGLGNGKNDRACRWSPESGIQDLGVLPYQAWSFACDVSGDGASVVGVSIPSYNYQRGFYWSEATGLVDLNFCLPSLGIDTNGWYFLWSVGISADGRWLTGYGYRHNQMRSWLVRLP